MNTPIIPNAIMMQLKARQDRLFNHGHSTPQNVALVRAVARAEDIVVVNTNLTYNTCTVQLASQQPVDVAVLAVKLQSELDNYLNDFLFENEDTGLIPRVQVGWTFINERAAGTDFHNLQVLQIDFHFETITPAYPDVIAVELIRRGFEDLYPPIEAQV